MRTQAILGVLPGLLLTGGIAALAGELAQGTVLTRLGIGTLTVAIGLGMLLGNLAPGALAARVGPGAALAQRNLLRLGVGLYGLRLTLQQIGGVGARGLLIDALVIACTLGLALWLGTRWLKLDRETALLVGAGSAICGAAAVMAAEPVVKAPPHKVAVAVATVTIYGSLSILVYPLLFPHLGLDAAQFGTYIGSTVHEVAQVVAAGKAVSPATADQAVVVKLIRVAMLAPVLLLLARLMGKGKAQGEGESAAKAPLLPWFIALFGVAAVVHSAGLLGPRVLHALLGLDNVLLAMAMAALGWGSHLRLLRQAGLKPLVLGAVLFGFLLVGGYAINRVVDVVGF